MRCPTCKSEDFDRHWCDPDILSCRECGETHTTTFLMAYHMGYLAGLKEKDEE